MQIKYGNLRMLISEVAGQSTLDRAVALATELHKDQRDKGGASYIGHPLRVMRSVLSKGYDEDVAIAAVLHDTVEDTPLTLDDVQQEFGPRRAATVALLSKQPGETYDAFIDRIIASGNRDAMQVKLADLEDNSDVKRLGREPTDSDKQRLTKYQRASQRIIAVLEAK